MVHRLLKKVLSKKEQKVSEEVARKADHLSRRERVAMEAEEDVNRYRVRFMKEKIGEVFDGVISGVAASVSSSN